MSSSSVTPSIVAHTLADLTSPGLMIPHLRGRDATSVIQELSHVMHAERRVPDLLLLYQTALNREFLMSTDMDAGMAFPHARLPVLKELSFALGRSTEPLAWGHRMPRSVRLVFLMAVPATEATQFLFLVSGLARLAQNSRLLAELHNAQDAFQMLEVFKQIELRTGSTPRSGLNPV